MTITRMSPTAIWRDLVQVGMSGRLATILLLLQGVLIVLEGIGLGMLMPVIEYVKLDGDMAVLRQESAIWNQINLLAAKFGLTASLELVLAVCFAAIAFRQITVYAANTFRINARERMIHDCRLSLFDSFMRCSYPVQASIPTGEIVNEAVIECGRAVRAAIQAVRMAGSALLVCAYVAALTAVSPSMSLLALLAVAVLFSVLFPLLRATQHTSSSIVVANRNLSAFVSEWVQHARLIRLGDRLDLAQREMTRRSKSQMTDAATLQILAERATLVIVPLTVGVTLGVLYLGISVIHLPVETLVIFIVAILRLLPVVKDTMSDYQAFLANLGSTKALIARMETLAKAREALNSSGKKIGGLIGDIRFDAVSYRYPNADRETLSNVDLTLNAGRITALIGPSGSGKSTIVELLSKLRTPTQGRILFGDTDLRALSNADVHRSLAYVPQDTGMLDITVSEFIAFARPSATENEIREAADAAGALTFIEALPEGFATRLGQNGRSLSGGQRQRLDIARAVLQKAEIIILDEPTSHLDPEATRKLGATLVALRDRLGVTIVLISHDMELAGMADSVAVMSDGRIVSQTPVDGGSMSMDTGSQEYPGADAIPKTSTANR